MASASPAAALARAGSRAAAVFGGASELGPAATMVGVAAVVAGAASAEGAYYPTSWGWLGLLLGWLAAVALVVRREVALSRLECATLLSVVAFVSWVAASALWSRDLPQTVLEVERDLVYPLGLAALLLIGRRASSAHVLAGICTAVTLVCTYSLATRLFPGRFGSFDPTMPVAGYRLNEPLGYWNALGIFAVMGALLALGFAALAPSTAVRALGAAALVILLPTLYYTFSRGAWIALGVGLVAALVVARRRLWLTTASLWLAPWPLLAVIVGSRLDGLTKPGESLRQAAHDGHRLALVVAVLAVAAAAAAVALAVAEQRISVPRSMRHAWAVCLLALVVGGLTTIFVRYGSPPALVRKAYHAFQREGRFVKPGESFQVRLFNFGSKGRVEAWHAAWGDYSRHPVLGSGAGSFEQYWLQHRPNTGKIRDAHSLYLEVLAELGPAGLALLVAVLGLPLTAAVRMRHDAAAPAAGAYVAYLLHAGIDWDWEMVALTLVALGIAGTVLLAARRRRATVELRLPIRAAMLATIVGAAAFAGVGLLGNYPLARSEVALVRGRWSSAAANADTAIRWQPWAAVPWQARGRAQRGQHDLLAARRSFLEAIERDAGDWSLWYDLGTVTNGAERRLAYAQAARLNPYAVDVAVICEQKLVPPRLCRKPPQS